MSKLSPGSHVLLINLWSIMERLHAMENDSTYQNLYCPHFLVQTLSLHIFTIPNKKIPHNLYGACVSVVKYSLTIYLLLVSLKSL